MTRALITGISGQDGGYLAEHLLAAGYEVVGMARHPEALSTRAPEVAGRVRLVAADIRDAEAVARVVREVAPDEVYNLAAQTFVPASNVRPEPSAETTALGALHVLEAARRAPNPPRVFQASSSVMFGDPDSSPQDEHTPLRPVDVYGASKTFAHHLVGTYRRQLGLFACAGILYNHESPRRGEDFLPRKVTLAAARIALGLQRELVVGALDTKRDWGFAGEYMAAAHAMLQQPEPDDYVIGTGILHTGEDLVRLAFEAAGLPDWQRYVRQDAALLRPAGEARIHHLRADITKAREQLHWEPRVTLEALAGMMVAHDLEQERARGR